MRTLITWTCMILGVGISGVALSDALSWERWVAPGQVAGEAVLDQEIRPATSPVRRSRFARPVPRGWAAPGLVGVRDRPDESWRPRLAQLGLPVAAQAPRLGVGPAGEARLSVGRDAVAPLPRVRLVKDVLAAMPDKCDERLFGTWYCGISCFGLSCDAHQGVVTLRRSIDPDGYERVHQRYEIHSSIFLSEWKVERKWGPPPSLVNNPMEKGKLIAASCNGKSDAGYSRLSVNLKSPDGSERYLYVYWVDASNRTMRRHVYEVRWEGDTMHRKAMVYNECRRELAE